MLLESFETLIIALLFLAPGALFLLLHERARFYSPAMQSEYLRRKSPFELTVFYLLASSLIHSVLLFLLGCLLFITARITRNPDLIREWHKAVVQFPKVSTSEFVSISMASLVYLAFGLLLAYLGAKRLRHYLLLPEPLWCEELIKIIAQGGNIDVCF